MMRVAILSILITIKAPTISAVGAKAMAVNFHEVNAGKPTEQVTQEMRCPSGFPKKSMDGCCRWSSPPAVCSEEKLKNSTKNSTQTISTFTCMQTLCERGKEGTWSLYKPDPSGPGTMNVCCNQRLASLQSHIVKGSGFYNGGKSLVARGSMDAFDPTAGDPTNSKYMARNIALVVLVLTLSLFAARQVSAYMQKNQLGYKPVPQTQEFGLPSGSKNSTAPSRPAKAPAPMENLVDYTTQKEDSRVDSAKEELLDFHVVKAGFSPDCLEL